MPTNEEDKLIPDALINHALERDALDEVEKGIPQSQKLSDQEAEAAMNPDAGLPDADIFHSNRGATNMETLRHFMQVNAEKNALLTWTKDTKMGSTLEEYLGIVAELGFEKALELPFTGTGYGDDPCQEKYFIFWRKDGILLSFDTFNGDRVNGGHMYYNWLANKPGFREGATSSGGYVRPPGRNWNDIKPDEILVWAGNHDCREALKFHIRQLEKHGKFMPKWVERPFLWLLHYQDHPHDMPWQEIKSDEINEKRILMLPPHVREAITPRTTPKGGEHDPA